MKKLLCIVCLLATVLFVNAADASTGSPVRNGRSTYSLNTVRVSTTCATCGRVATPVVKPVVHTIVVRPTLRPKACTSCGRRVVRRPVIRRPVIRTTVRPVVRTTFCTTCGRRSYVSGRTHVIVTPARYHVLKRSNFYHKSGKRFACTRCGK